METKLWEKYRRRIEELKISMPNTKFEGVLTDKDGNPIDCLILFGYASNLINNTNLGGEKVLPKVSFNISPIPNAYALPSGDGYLNINLGIALAVFAFPQLTALLDNVLSDTEPKSMDFIENIQISDDIIEEIDSLASSWKEASVNKWASMKFPKFFSIENRTWGCNLNCIVVYHEFGHLLKLYKPEMYNQRINYVSKIVNDWKYQNKDLLFQFFGDKLNNQIIDNWIKELDADRTGYGTLFNTEVDKFFGLSQLKIMNYQASMSLFYFLLELLEFSVFGNNIQYQSHPPSEIRRELFINIEANVQKVSPAEFVSKYWGAGYIILLLLSRIFGIFINRYGKKYL